MRNLSWSIPAACLVVLLLLWTSQQVFLNQDQVGEIKDQRSKIEIKLWSYVGQLRWLETFLRFVGKLSLSNSSSLLGHFLISSFGSLTAGRWKAKLFNSNSKRFFRGPSLCITLFKSTKQPSENWESNKQMTPIFTSNLIFTHILCLISIQAHL